MKGYRTWYLERMIGVIGTGLENPGSSIGYILDSSGVNTIKRIMSEWIELLKSIANTRSTDNPPPKVVQGYKFNIFYPDLMCVDCLTILHAHTDTFIAINQRRPHTISRRFLAILILRWLFLRRDHLMKISRSEW
jgi:hypothetical protein